MTTPAPSIIAARYRVIRELGRGGMGVVYLVEHAHTGDQLALKVLLAHAGASADVVERFKREARAPARIKSEHVVRITDADVAPELGGAPFLVMECLQGKDLEKTLDARGKIPAAELVWIFRQVATALDKAHALGIVHRDLKPENVFLHERDAGDTVVKILDFGISKMNDDGTGGMAQAGLTRSGVAMGTPLYMAPEQARGLSAQIGPPTDMWALGLIAYRLLTGRIYWTSMTLAELMVEVLTGPMQPPSQRGDVPPAFDAWFLRSCDRDPTQRWRSAGEQVAAMAEALGIVSTGTSHRELKATDALPAVAASSHVVHASQVASSSLMHDSGRTLPVPPHLVHSASPITQTSRTPAEGIAAPRSRAPIVLGLVAAAAIAGVALFLVGGQLGGSETPVGPSAAATAVGAPTTLDTEPMPVDAPEPTASAAPDEPPRPATTTSASVTPPVPPPPAPTMTAVIGPRPTALPTGGPRVKTTAAVPFNPAAP